MKREPIGRGYILTCTDCRPSWEMFAPGEQAADRLEREHMKKKHANTPAPAAAPATPTAPAPRPRPAARPDTTRGSSWDTREEPTWIDKM